MVSLGYGKDGGAGNSARCSMQAHVGLSIAGSGMHRGQLQAISLSGCVIVAVLGGGGDCPT